MINKIVLLLLGVLITGVNISTAGDLTVNGKLEVSDGTNRLVTTVGPTTYWGTYNAADFGLMTNNAARLYLKNNGDIGVGITTPEAKLHIVGAGGYGIIYRTSNNGTNNFWIHEDGTGYFRGPIGIGTFPNQGYQLHIRGGSALIEGGTWQSSDANLKQNIQPISSALNKVMVLNGVSYEWKKDAADSRNLQPGRANGILAQELEGVLPDAVRTEPDGTKAVEYAQIIPLLIEAVKDQQNQIIRQQKSIEELKRMLSAAR